MKRISLLCFIALAFSEFAIAQKGFTTTKTGLKYKIIKQNKNARKVNMEDVLTLGVIVRNSKDSIIDNTYNKVRPLRFQLASIPFKGSMEEGLLLLAEGDSAVFLVKSDSLYNSQKGQKQPAYVASKSDVSFTVKVKKVQTFDDFKKEKHEHFIAQKTVDDKAINDYLTKNNLKAEKTELGLYYIVTNSGDGLAVEKGNLVQVHYTGKILEGEQKFDSSLDKKIPFEINIGMGLWIKGLDEGIIGMKKGEKRTFLIPSYLAYGEKGQHKIVPPNSPLLFEIELINFSK